MQWLDMDQGSGRFQILIICAGCPTVLHWVPSTVGAPCDPFNTVMEHVHQESTHGAVRDNLLDPLVISVDESNFHPGDICISVDMECWLSPFQQNPL